MFKVGGWLGGKAKGHGHAMSLNALDEISQIQDAMAAVSHIMNDDVNTAEALLSKGSSPFHQLAKGVVTFIRATLGFEQETMREASATLTEAENAAYDHQRRAAGNTSAYQSPIYPPGTEFAVCLAEARLMNAIVGVLNESLTEAIKSFYKLRKAYLTLEGIMDAEKKYVMEKSTSSLGSNASERASTPASQRSAKSRSQLVAKNSSSQGQPSAAASSTSVNKISNSKEDPSQEKEKTRPNGEDDDDDFDFVDADEDHSDIDTPQEYMGHLDSSAKNIASPESEGFTEKLNGKSSSAHNPASTTDPDESKLEVIENMDHLTLTETIKEGEDISLFGDHPVDVFIISGANFCFGVLLLIISLVPPVFATLLKVVGFKGDRERGLQMLWQATKFHNIHGAMAALVLFSFYNGLFAFCDIVPQSGPGSYPQARCNALLAEMRERHPKSHLWLIEESRRLGSEKKIEEAIEFSENCPECPLKQLHALQWFERSLNEMYIHNYEGTSAAFQKCVTLNNWSHSLYYYIAGACHVEAYRRLKASDPAEAAKQKEKAKQLFDKVAPNIGRKKFMARQLPFDVFVNRKVQKWEARAKEWSCDFIDAVGVSPLEEVIYFWNGYKRMREEHLQTSLENLAWSESDQNPHWEKEGLDEKGILALLRAAVLRSLDKTEEAKEVLRREIIAHDRNLFKGPLKDNWTPPCARYEMAACLWREADHEGKPEEHGGLLEKCKDYLEETARWESYDLDTRIGLKVTTAKGTLRRYGVEC